MSLVYTKEQVEQIRSLLQEREQHQLRIQSIGLQIELIAEKVLRASGISDQDARVDINPADWSLVLASAKQPEQPKEKKGKKDE